ncbi:MAG: tryptophan synthase subunit alpha [Thermoleophilia bacterium]|nr:tryptophan synthase subunit alpha [Thermoleophilia bacterium]
MWTKQATLSESTPMPESGVERLQRVFREANRPLFVPYVMGGYPDLTASTRHARILGEYADIIELGIPFSDPLADGPTIQAAGQMALDGGTRPSDVLGIAAQLRDGPPVVVMTYVNTLLAKGVIAFLQAAAEAGVAGIIIPDLPVDEAGEVRDAARTVGIALIALAAPTTDDARMAEIGAIAEGFVYLVAVTGVTGGEMRMDDRLVALVARARRHIGVPLVVGFGVRTPDQAVQIGGLADGVVIASEIIRRISDAPDSAAADAAVATFGAVVSEALRT